MYFQPKFFCDRFEREFGFQKNSRRVLIRHRAQTPAAFERWRRAVVHTQTITQAHQRKAPRRELPSVHDREAQKQNLGMCAGCRGGVALVAW
jgi:hypothetical protein